MKKEKYILLDADGGAFLHIASPKEVSKYSSPATNRIYRLPGTKGSFVGFSTGCCMHPNVLARQFVVGNEDVLGSVIIGRCDSKGSKGLLHGFDNSEVTRLINDLNFWWDSFLDFY